MSRLAPVAAALGLLLGCGPGEAPPPRAPLPPPSPYASLSPDRLPAPPPDATNRWADDAAAAALGQRLFFDPGFSGALLDGDNDGSSHTLGARGQTGKVACAGCHAAAAGFLDDRTLGEQVSLAAGWGHRRAPSLLDVGQARVVMWDGRHDALYNQVFGPIESPLEMNSSRLFVAEQVWQRYRTDYEAVFGPLPPLGDGARFPPLAAALTGCQPSTPDPTPSCHGTRHGMPGDGAEYDGLSPADQDAVTRVVVNLGKAIAAYERRLSCGPGRFDAWVHGQPDAMSASEQRGAALFVGKAQCESCHAGAFFTDQQFHAVGLQPTLVSVIILDDNDHGARDGLAAALADPLNVRGAYSDGDDGRLPASVGVGMDGAFRTPGLRCASLRPSFMHTAQPRTLDEVVAFFDRGGDRGGYAGHGELGPLGLSAQERADLVAFLGALSGPGPDPGLLHP